VRGKIVPKSQAEQAEAAARTTEITETIVPQTTDARVAASVSAVDSALVDALQVELDEQQEELTTARNQETELVDRSMEAVRNASNANREVEAIKATMSPADTEMEDLRKRVALRHAETRANVDREFAKYASVVLTNREFTEASAPPVEDPRYGPEFVARVRAEHGAEIAKLGPVSARAHELSGAVEHAEATTERARVAKRKAEEHSGTVEQLGKKMGTKRARFLEKQERAGHTKQLADKARFRSMTVLDSGALRIPTSLQNDSEMTNLRDERDKLLKDAKIGALATRYDSENNAFDQWLKDTTSKKDLADAIGRLRPLITREAMTDQGKRDQKNIAKRIARMETRKSRLKSGGIQVSGLTGMSRASKRTKPSKGKKKTSEDPPKRPKKVGSGFVTAKKSRKPKKKVPKPEKKPTSNSIARYFI